MEKFMYWLYLIVMIILLTVCLKLSSTIDAQKELIQIQHETIATMNEIQSNTIDSLLEYLSREETKEVVLESVPPVAEMMPTVNANHIDDMVDTICKNYPNIEPYIIKNMIMVESTYNPDAENGPHLGLMQINPKWQTERMAKLGVHNLFDPYQNILLGVDYFNDTLTANNGNVELSLMVYNMGPSKASEYWSRGETTSYVTKIIQGG